MKKILISSYDLNYGGIETSLINLLKSLNLEKYKVTLVLEHNSGVYLKDVPKNIKIKEYKVSENNNVIIRKIINLLKRIKWIICNYKRYNASICYATYSKPCSFVARTASSNRILYVHSNYYLTYDKDEQKVREFFNGLKITKYNHLVFVSNESKKDIINIYPKMEKKAITINNIIDQNNIIKLSMKNVQIPKTNKKKFIFVGRLEESSKRLTLLLDTAKKCKEEKVNAIFWIIGNGPDEKKYKKIASDENLDNIIFMKTKKNPYPYMAASDLLVCSSFSEGLSVVLGEALILGCSVLSTNCGGHQAFLQDGKWGRVVENSHEGLYNGLKEYLQDCRTAMPRIPFNEIRAAMRQRDIDSADQVRNMLLSL